MIQQGDWHQEMFQMFQQQAGEQEIPPRVLKSTKVQRLEEELLGGTCSAPGCFSPAWNGDSWIIYISNTTEDRHRERILQ